MSDYPNKIDNLKSLPKPNQSNILEFCEAARSSLLKIEQTLGINPQGQIGKTLAERLSVCLDSFGNLKNSTSYVITDELVSENAGIKESKISLSVPTSVLNSQIASIKKDFDSFYSTLTTLNDLFSVHVNSEATRRHSAKNISLEKDNYISQSDVQEAISFIFKNHISFSLDASSQYNSHNANTIFYDNTDSGLASSNVQAAISELVGQTSTQIEATSKTRSSNGLISKLNPEKYGSVLKLASDIRITTTATSGKISEFYCLIESTIEKNFSIGDILCFSYNDVDYSFAIKQIIMSGDNVSALYLFGFFNRSVTIPSAYIKYCQTKQIEEPELLSAAIASPNLTSIEKVIVISPSAAKCVSYRCNPAEISGDNRYFNFSFGGGDPIEIDVFSSGKISLSSIVSKINEKFSKTNLPFVSGIVNKDSGSEIFISAIFSTKSSDDLSFSISRGSDDAIDSLGFTEKTYLSIEGAYYLINGVSYSELNTKLDTSSLQPILNSGYLEVTSTSIDLSEHKIIIGDILLVLDGQDSKMYIITEISSSKIYVDTTNFSSGFQSSFSSDARFIVVNNSVDFSDSNFIDVDGTYGNSLFQIFLNENNDLNFNKIAEYSSLNDSSGALFDIVYLDTEKESFVITFTLIDSVPYLSIDSNANLMISGDRKHISFDFVDVKGTIFISDFDRFVSALTSDLSTTVYCYDNVNMDSNLSVSYVSYHNWEAKVAGNSYPEIYDSLQRGFISEKELSSSAKLMITSSAKDIIENAIIFGCDITNITDNDGKYKFSISNGYVYVAGEKISILEKEIKTDIDILSADKIFVAIDCNSNIICSESNSVCGNPFSYDYCVIGTIEYYDEQFHFIKSQSGSNLLSKISEPITISNQRYFGHFPSFKDAIFFAKRFSDFYKKALTPTIMLKSGDYINSISITTTKTKADWLAALVVGNTEYENYFNKLISAGMLIDFPVNIKGDGEVNFYVKINLSADDGEHTLYSGLYVSGNSFNLTNTVTSNFHDIISDGTVSIEGISFVDSGINILDFVILDSSLSAKNVLVNICKNKFICDKDNSSEDYIFKGVSFSEVTNSVNLKGNVSIFNNFFIGCGFDIYPTNMNTRLKNINIVENNYKDMIDATNARVGFLNANFFDFSSYPDSCNINIVGNVPNAGYYSNSTGLLAPKMYYASISSYVNWADRISRDIYSGWNAYIKNNATITGTASANDYVFSSTLQHKKNIPFSNVVLQGAWYSNVAFNYSLSYPKCIEPIGSSWYYYVDLTDQVIYENINSFNLIVSKTSGSSIDTKVSLYQLTSLGSLLLLEESEVTISNSVNLQTITYEFTSTSASSTTKGFYAKVENTSGSDPITIYNMYLLFENTSLKKTLLLS